MVLLGALAFRWFGLYGLVQVTAERVKGASPLRAGPPEVALMLLILGQVFGFGVRVNTIMRILHSPTVRLMVMLREHVLRTQSLGRTLKHSFV